MKPFKISTDETNAALREAGQEFRRTGNANGAFIEALRRRGYHLSSEDNGVSNMAPLPDERDPNNRWNMPCWIVPIVSD